MSIMTNIGLLYVSPQIKSYAASMNIEPPELFFYFIILEHVLLAIRYVLHQAIPDKPEWVRIALARKNHIFKNALKKEVCLFLFLPYRFYDIFNTTLMIFFYRD